MSPGVKPKARKAWLGLGGNIGQVKYAMIVALDLLQQDPDITIETVSPLYKTPPWGLKDQPWFLNCCAQVETSLQPEALLELCQAAERAGKRERTIRWGPRTIDVDILMIEGVEQTEQRLTVPHPRMLERAFVLVPLNDIAPNARVSGKAVSHHVENVDVQGLEVEDASKDWWMPTNENLA